MIYFAMFALLVWVPVVYMIFETLPGNKAVVVSFVFAWLFLPTLQIGLSGIPDWSKMTATTFGVSLVAYLKHLDRLRVLKFRWYDLPVLIYCVCPLTSALYNNQGAYDGISAVIEEVFRWGLPYMIGRAFLGDQRGNYLLCLGIAVGGLVYVPFCLFEIRMSPILKPWVYGFSERNDLDYALRYGGYRPIVFLSFGLELGWWMCCASLACFNLWKSGAVKQLRGYSMGVLTAGIVLVTIACKSTGAIVLISFGVMTFAASRLTKSTILIWAMLTIAPLYCACRPFGIWDGSTLINISSSVFGPDRTQSLAFRFEQEEILMRSAMQQPIFGWARAGGFNPSGPDARGAVTDGLWIIVFGSMGSVGLAGLNMMLILPTILFLRRFKIQDWLTPDVAPSLTLAMILPLFMLDNLSNAMLNPIYAVAMGAISGYVPRRQNQRRNQQNSQSSKSGSLHGMISEWTQTGSLLNAPPDQAAADYEAAAVHAARHQFNEEAWEQFGAAIECRQAVVAIDPAPEQLDRLARSHVLFARFLTRIAYPQYAVEHRRQALQVWRNVMQAGSLMEKIIPSYAANLNDLAWMMIFEESGTAERLDQAVAIAEEAVQIVPEHAAYWNTLGIVYYRRQEYYKAIRALSQSVQLDEDGGNAFDFYYLALANQALGYSTPARDWLDRAETWSKKHPDLGSALDKVEDEVASVLSKGKKRTSRRTVS